MRIEYSLCAKEALGKLDNYKISFADENAKAVFVNHIDSLETRLKDNMVLSDDILEENILRELSEESLNIAESLVCELFEKYQTPISRIEVVLIATHVQLALRSRKEGVE